MEENNKDLLQEQYVAQGGSTGYVKPISVDNTNIDISTSHLNGRERDNIVKASIQANNNISEEQVTTVNNEIQVKKKRPVVAIILIVVLIIGIIVIIKLVPPVVNKYVDSKTTTTETTTTTKNNEIEVLKYLRDENSLRKFSNDSMDLLLLPFGYDLHENNHYYLLVDSNTTQFGTYNMASDKINLMSNDTLKEISINKDHIIIDSNMLSMHSNDYKLYTYKDSNVSKLVLIDNNSILYIDSNNQITNNYSNVVEEDDTSIKISSTEISFNKIDDKTIQIDGVNLTLM